VPVPDPAVAVQGLTKRYGAQVAVDDLTFDVPLGQVVGFLGPNGSGKSTTMRMIVGLTAPTAGTATLLGTPFHELDDPVRTVGSIVDGVDYHPGRRAIEELRISAATAGLLRSRCDEVIERVGLGDAALKRVGQYSLGMRQRLGIAQALLGDPQILLLDEPANGLDPEGIHWVRELLRGLADEGRAALVSSHLLGEVARLADEVLVIRRGRFVTQAPVDALTQAASAGVVRVAREDDPRLVAALDAAGLDASVSAEGLQINGSSTAAVGRIAREAGIVLTGLYPVVPDLEEVFMELTSGGGIA